MRKQITAHHQVLLERSGVVAPSSTKTKPSSIEPPALDAEAQAGHETGVMSPLPMGSPKPRTAQRSQTSSAPSTPGSIKSSSTPKTGQGTKLRGLGGRTRSVKAQGLAASAFSGPALAASSPKHAGEAATVLRKPAQHHPKTAEDKAATAASVTKIRK